jgi:hypothetical protein
VILPIIFGLICWAITDGVGGDSSANYLAESGLALSGISLLAIPVSYLFRWDWRSSFYGASIFGIASVASFGIYPILSILIFSSLPFIVRILIICAEISVIISWCTRFVRIYEVIYSNKKLFDHIYVEKSEATYFFVQRDKQVLERELDFKQFPKGRYFVGSLALALIVGYFGKEFTALLGIPFTQLFWAVAAAPLPAAFLGTATKIWLVCYRYPRLIKASTGKLTYVDMGSK